jgi:DNA-binding protein YbaB
MVEAQPNGGQDWLDAYTRKVAVLAQRAEQVQADLKSIRAQASSPDETITVVLAPGGRVESIELSEQAMAHGHRRLGTMIAETIRAAHNQTLDRTRETMAPLLGDSPAMEFLDGHLAASRADPPDVDPEKGQHSRTRDDDDFQPSVLR